MNTDTQKLILSELKELRSEAKDFRKETKEDNKEIRTDIRKLNKEVTNLKIDNAVLKTKTGHGANFWAAVTGLVTVLTGAIGYIIKTI